MKGYVADIEKLTEQNEDFRKVLYTGHHLQLVLMSLHPNQGIGAETHATHDQFFRIEQGLGVISINGRTQTVTDGHCIIVPAGALHNLTNTGTQPLRIYTLYAPPEHLDGLVQHTKADADASDEAFDGTTSE